jgi:hypothetical protein
MNPLNWSRPQQVALCIWSVIGAFVGTIVGYFVYCGGDSGDALSLTDWIAGEANGISGYDPSAIYWLVMGAIFGAVVMYAIRLSRISN